jgi:hypothetical protein
MESATQTFIGITSEIKIFLSGLEKKKNRNKNYLLSPQTSTLIHG